VIFQGQTVKVAENGKEQIMSEVWKDIKGYEGIYQVSNKGRVKRIKVSTGANLRTIRPSLSAGYPAVGLHKNDKRERFYVHRLVAEAFIPNPENKPQVNHKDGNKRNPVSSNLEWCTSKENYVHAACKLGVMYTPRGSQQGNSLLTEVQVLEIKKSSLKQRELAVIYKVAISTIGTIRCGRSWKHVKV
jgi:hypothetical protein